MQRRTAIGLIVILALILAACASLRENDSVRLAEAVVTADSTLAVSATPTDAPAVSAVATRAPTTTATPTSTFTPSPTPEPTATTTTTPTATPVITPSDVVIERLSGLGPGPGPLFVMEHPLFGEVYVLDELNVDTPLKVSWSDDNPRSAVVRYRDAESIIVELLASTEADYRSIPIESVQSDVVGRLPRHSMSLNSAEFFSAATEVERLVTIEIVDANDNRTSVQLLVSRHDYEPGYTGPMALAQPLYDQLALGLDWRTEAYALQGRFAGWLDEHPELWDRVTVEVEGHDPFSWRAMRVDKRRLHEELTAAQYGDPLALYYVTADGRRQRFALDSVPYYTKFELVHSPQDEREFYTLRAGRDDAVTQKMLEEMGDVVRHMFTNRPNYLHQLAENGAIHSVAPGENLRALPEVRILEEEVGDVVGPDDDYGLVLGVAIFARHPELSVSAGYYFEHDVPARGYVMMHEIVHQVQYMIYGPSWSEAVANFYENYMALPARQRIPDVAYHETSPWEWDALLTSAWFAQGSDLYDHVAPYLDLEVGASGTTIREHLQMRWGDPLSTLDDLE